MSETLIAAYIGLVASFIVAVVALFQKQIRSALYGARLEICFDHESEVDAHVAPGIVTDERGEQLGTIPELWLRIRVANVGGRVAKNIEVIVRDLMRRSASGQYIHMPKFLPLSITWSYLGVLLLAQIPTGIEKHCDLLKIQDPNRAWDGTPMRGSRVLAQIQLEVQHSTNPGILEAGDYALTMTATSESCSPSTYEIFFTVPSAWIEHEREMVRLLNVRGLPSRSTYVPEAVR